MDLRKVKAVLFDLDGTLLDTAKDIGTCLNEVMCRYGYPARPLSDVPSFIGHGRNNLLKAALPEGVGEEIYPVIADEYAAHYRANCTRFTEYYPGAREFLDFLQGRGYLTGMITNKTQETAEKIVKAYFPGNEFRILWGNNGVRPLKPSPESAELACRTLGLQPGQILFLGDGDTDMDFASRAGFVACGVTWGYRSREVLQDHGADVLVDSFSELEKLLSA